MSDNQQKFSYIFNTFFRHSIRFPRKYFSSSMKIFNVFYLSNFEIFLKKDILQYLFIKSIVNTFVDIAF